MSCSKNLKNGELLELIAWGRAELTRAGIEEAQEECERILMKLLGCARSEIYLAEHELDVLGVRGHFLKLIEKRVQRIPLAYLLKEADFWQETLFVDERCLIPRPETEILVEQVLKAMKGDSPSKSLKGTVPLASFSFLDIGTGSGAIAIALLRACQNAQATMLDASQGAIEVARRNIEKYGLQGRAALVQGDLFAPFKRDEKWDLIVSNPPYLSKADFQGLQEELRFEPRGALEGGKDGLDFYRKIVAEAQGHLTPGGWLALEVGLGQAVMVSKWLHDAGYDNIQRFNDHLQVQRVVMAQRHS